MGFGFTRVREQARPAVNRGSKAIGQSKDGGTLKRRRNSEITDLTRPVEKAFRDWIESSR
jgi:hypothetical protein